MYIMRNINFYIHNRVDCGNGIKYTVYLDNVSDKPAGSIKRPNFKSSSVLTIPVDENAHTIVLHYDSFGNKSEAAKVSIPSGNHDYSFFTQIVDLGNRGITTIRPGTGIKFKDKSSFPVKMIGLSIMDMMLDERIRGFLRSGNRLLVEFSEKKWSVSLVSENSKQVICDKEYPKQYIKMIVAVDVSSGVFATETGRQKCMEELHTYILQYMDEYRMVSPGLYELI